MEKVNIRKSQALYDLIDAARCTSPVRKSDRSRMNIPFAFKDRPTSSS